MHQARAHIERATLHSWRVAQLASRLLRPGCASQQSFIAVHDRFSSFWSVTCLRLLDKRGPPGCSEFFEAFDRSVSKRDGSRQRALEAANTFSSEEGTSGRMTYHGLDHFATMALLALPAPSLDAPIMSEVLVLLATKFHNHVSTRWAEPPTRQPFSLGPG